MAKMRWSRLEWERKTRTHEPLADPHLSVPTELQRQIEQTTKSKKKKKKKRRKDLSQQSNRGSDGTSSVTATRSTFTGKAARELPLGSLVHSRADNSRVGVVLATYKMRSGGVVGYTMKWQDGAKERVNPEAIQDPSRVRADIATSNGAEEVPRESTTRGSSRSSGAAKRRHRRGRSVRKVGGGAPSLGKRR
jgi:hypothetical protein